MIEVITSDNEHFQVENDVAVQCGMLADFATNGTQHWPQSTRMESAYLAFAVRLLCIPGQDISEPIPFPNVNSEVFKKVKSSDLPKGRHPCIGLARLQT